MQNNRDVRKPFTIRNNFGETITGDVLYPETDPHPAVLVIVHSFMAFKNWGFFPFLGEEFARRGYITILFNFSRNGVTGHGDRITEFLKFSENTFSHELQDLQVVIDRIFEGSIIGEFHPSMKLVLLGHSRGGGISILTASRDNRVHGLVTWSSIASFDRWTDHQKNLWRQKGFLHLSPHNTIGPLKLGVNLLRDIEENSETHNILHAAQKVVVPWLIIHGVNDLTVPLREGEMLFHAANSRSTEFVRLPAAGHLFNAATRTEDNYTTLESVIKITDTWIEKSIY